MKKTNIIYIAIAAVLLLISVLMTRLPQFKSISEGKSEGKHLEFASTLQITTAMPESVSETVKETVSEVVTEEVTEEETEEVTEVNEIDYEELIDFDSYLPFLIKVNRAANCVTVYGKDFDGEYSVAYKSMACSTGLFAGNTPLGEYEISEKFDWRMMIDDSYAQYAVRFNDGVMFHSIPYFSMDKSDMEWEEYNKLGTAASLGCVRLRVVDAKWIYDNCPIDTKVIVYDDEENPGELGKPSYKKIGEENDLRGWDPTDPDEENPWHK